MILMPYTIGGMVKRTRIVTNVGSNGKEWRHAEAAENLKPGDLLGVFHGPLAMFPFVNGVVDYGDLDGGYVLDIHVNESPAFGPMWLLGMLVGPPRQVMVGGPVSPVEVMNHSCDPNCEMVGPHKLAVAARKHVTANTELTLDYRTFTLVPTGQLCNCKNVPEAERCVI